MKHKFSIFLLFFCISISVFCQNQTTKSENHKSAEKGFKHELKFNPVFALLSIPEISYEGIINRESSIGLSMSYTVDQDHIDIDYMITPYYRYYLGKNESARIYLEGNVTYFKESSIYLTPAVSKTDISIGGGLGFKILRKDGLVLDFIAGLGRVLSKSESFYTNTTPRFGVSIGKRLFSSFGENQKNGREKIFNEKKNEIRLNLLHLAVGFPELSYERLLNNNTSIGLSFSYSLTDKFFEQFFIIPNYRFYWGEKLDSNFFVELGAIYWKENFENETRISKSTGFGGEFGIGYKLRKIPNYPIEILVGFGRSFINQYYLENWFVPRFGLSIGKKW